jgi:hypothetical protein
MASNSANVGSRQKRRKVRQEMDNILLSVEADFSVADGVSMLCEKEDICAYEDTTGEAVYDGDSQQVEHQWEHFETVSEFYYESDLEPLESSDDECELFSDDDGTLIHSWCDDELPTEIHLSETDVPVLGFKEKLASWAVEYRVKQNAVDGLLTNVLPTLPDYDKLNIPKSCRTLLNTMKKHH